MGDVGQPGYPDPGTRLARRLDLSDAVVLGLGSMIGAGVFSALAPAARAAGGGLLLGLAMAAAVAYCNATSSAQLAALYPDSGGTYVYGRERLGPFWGFLAGWGFVIGKTASCAAMALTFGAYAWPEARRPLAVAAVATVALVNYRGVQKTARLTRVIVAVVLAALAAVVCSVVFGGAADVDRIGPVFHGGVYGTLQSAGLLFFAFAGYARIATLGEEVANPARTIPRAVPLALGITLIVYAAIAVAALAAAGPEQLVATSTPLSVAVRAGSLDALSGAVRIGATVGSLGVLLSLVAGVGRTAFAMAANGDLPRGLNAVHPRYRVPHRAELAVAAVVIAVVSVADLRGAIGFSSFAVLAYYAIANACAWTLRGAERRWPRALAGAGLTGCVVLAAALPLASVVGGMALLATGAAAWGLRVRRR